MSRNLSRWGMQCKRQMLELGKTYADVSKEIGKSRIYICQIVTGKAIPPKETYDAISEALDVDPDLPKAVV